MSTGRLCCRRGQPASRSACKPSFAPAQQNSHRFWFYACSMGGWNGNCFPYAYALYSVGGYGTSTPNYYKIAAYGGVSGCNATNQWCFVCEPPYEDPVRSACLRRILESCPLCAASCRNLLESTV